MARLLSILLCLVCAGPLAAERGSLFPTAGAAQTGAVEPRPGSLFAGRADNSLFARVPVQPQPAAARPSVTLTGPAAQLLDLIALAEAGPAGYDAVQYGARVRPGRPPTQMTIAEIYAWIEATPGQPHAIGRYQFIPPTLRRLVRQGGFSPGTRFSPEVQDQLALMLLEEAGLQDFRAGRLSRTRFMRNLARIWAGLPLPSGQSYYQGHAGNAATMSWTRFSRGMDRIFPASG